MSKKKLTGYNKVYISETECISLLSTFNPNKLKFYMSFCENYLTKLEYTTIKDYGCDYDDIKLHITTIFNDVLESYRLVGFAFTNTHELLKFFIDFLPKFYYNQNYNLDHCFYYRKPKNLRDRYNRLRNIFLNPYNIRYNVELNLVTEIYDILDDGLITFF